MKTTLAAIHYKEDLASGNITIGNLVYKPDWNKIVEGFGFSREIYTYITDEIDNKDFTMYGILYILKKDNK